MRLLKIPTDGLLTALPQLVEFSPDRIPVYAILSHRWGAPTDEVLYNDMRVQHGDHIESLKEKKGYAKLEYSCQQALKDGISYLWIDTCCIDKSSSAELSEAINSMYFWYSKAAVCYAYLDDVSTQAGTGSSDPILIETLWATRGWTLQELLAPSEVIFYSTSWVKLGSKITLSYVLSKMTNIDEDFLTGKKPLESASIAKRMSWAAQRQTTRPEDIAYCLMGIFSVNMPMLYGEGDKAFLRLQEEIMKHSDDHSLFAWTAEDVPDDTYHGLLAKHPSQFKHSKSIIPYQDREIRQPFSMSNRGLQIELHLNKIDGPRLYAAALDCPVPPLFADSTFLTIYLEKLPGADFQYARVNAGRFGEIHQRGKLQTVYIRQNVIVPDIEGVYPNHVLQLRRFKGPYRVSEVVVPRGMVPPPAVSSSRADPAWFPYRNRPPTCRIVSKAEKSLCCALHVIWHDEEAFLIMIGSSGGNQIGFCVVEWDPTPITLGNPIAELENDLYQPIPMGSRATTGYHDVHVTAEPLIDGGSKYYMIDISVEEIERPAAFLDAILDRVEDIVTPIDGKKGNRFKKLRQVLGRPG